ncbi:hypothetical protein PpBr36_00120 [Pyricularia pennisetigena]|uniref:hypothetical protein n=1 Tax=Pyricularia pennisetigena TaxID=1578925 RepID=UPI00114EBF3D|nr:hypothetical protein PpBr36_00120 [Pyricularia pennisetigena]TLS29237.1 hypothetical protein PpBr36_00120 [Pyricularia pennisetigena]
MDLEIFLIIAEEAELPALSALMRTNSRIYSGIVEYEQSICKSRMQRYMLPPSCDVVCTRTPEREVYPRFSLDTIGELERRQKRIASIVNHNILSANSTISEECRSRYVAGLERALHMCDHILDLSNQDSERKAQVEYIKTLSTVDLAFLFETAWMGSVGWARSRGADAATDPDYLHKMLAFEELVLRQGSVFLWGLTQGSDKFYKHSIRQMEMVAAEIHDWEFNNGPKLPSLRLAVVYTFVDKKKCTLANFTQHMAAIVEREIKGPLPPAGKEVIKGNYQQT